jgi:hypothetical protein
MTEYLQGVSVRLAKAMDRRRFIRRAASGTFAGVAALTAGRLISPTKAFAYASVCESTTGYGCPYGCGPSKCCAAQTGGCVCSDGHGGCKSGTTNCHGKIGDWGGQSCWTCTWRYCGDLTVLYQVSTTCCDCYTTGCSSDPDHICIAYLSTTTVVGRCGSATAETPLPAPPGTVVGVATGDPSTSWGIQPPINYN